MQQDILDRYPKKQNELPDEYKSIYDEHFIANREGKYKTTFFSQRLERWMHLQVGADIKEGIVGSTLEIGAGTLNQLPYEPECGPYDIVEPFHQFYQQSPNLKRIRNFFEDISEAKEHGPYNRITSIAVFEHITDLPVVVAQSALLLKTTGTLRVAIPNEGTPLWKLGTMVTGYEFNKHYGLSYDVLMRHLHVNTADEIENVLKIFFNKIVCHVFGVSRWLGLYRYYSCSEPNIKIAHDYLGTRDIAW